MIALGHLKIKDHIASQSADTGGSSRAEKAPSKSNAINNPAGKEWEDSLASLHDIVASAVSR
jgi:hypothetical protein